MGTKAHPLESALTLLFSRFGPDNLTRGTLSQDPDAIVPTVLGNLLAQGIIKSKVFSLSFDNSSSGELTLGGTDPAKFTGSITYTLALLVLSSLRYLHSHGTG